MLSSYDLVEELTYIAKEDPLSVELVQELAVALCQPLSCNACTACKKLCACSSAQAAFSKVTGSPL